MQLTTNQYWLWCLNSHQAMTWPSSLTRICVAMLSWVNLISWIFTYHEFRNPPIVHRSDGQYSKIFITSIHSLLLVDILGSVESKFQGQTFNVETVSLLQRWRRYASLGIEGAFYKIKISDFWHIYCFVGVVCIINRCIGDDKKSEP